MLRFFFTSMHDYECSVRKGYIQQAMDTERVRAAVSDFEPRHARIPHLVAMTEQIHTKTSKNARFLHTLLHSRTNVAKYLLLINWLLLILQDYESEGRAFESLRVHHFPSSKSSLS